MAKAKASESDQPTRKPLVWLHGEIKTPPFTAEGRQEAGMLLRLLQEGEQLGMPQAEPLPNVGPRCGALRVRDAEHNWRIMYRADSDAVLVLEVYPQEDSQDTGRSHQALQRPPEALRRSEQSGEKELEGAARAETMDTTKRKALEAAGWKIGDAADFLGMSAEERQVLDARVKLAVAIRQLRQAFRISQKELGTRLKTTQPRVAKIERAASDVSMDQLIRAFTAAGGKFVIRTRKPKATKGKSRAKKGGVVLEAVASR